MSEITFTKWSKRHILFKIMRNDQKFWIFRVDEVKKQSFEEIIFVTSIKFSS